MQQVVIKVEWVGLQEKGTFGERPLVPGGRERTQREDELRIQVDETAGGVPVQHGEICFKKYFESNLPPPPTHTELLNTEQRHQLPSKAYFEVLKQGCLTIVNFIIKESRREREEVYEELCLKEGAPQEVKKLDNV